MRSPPVAIWGFLWDNAGTDSRAECVDQKKGLTGRKQRIKGNVLEWRGITVAGILSRFAGLCTFQCRYISPLLGASVAYISGYQTITIPLSYLSISID